MPASVSVCVCVDMLAICWGGGMAQWQGVFESQPKGAGFDPPVSAVYLLASSKDPTISVRSCVWRIDMNLALFFIIFVCW